MDVKMQLAGHSQSTYDYKRDNVESLIMARSYNDNSVSNVISLVLSYILQTPILGLTQECLELCPSLGLHVESTTSYTFTPCEIF